MEIPADVQGLRAHVATELIDSWRGASADGIVAMQQQSKIGDLTYLEAAPDEGISAWRVAVLPAREEWRC
ncbi:MULTISPECIES: hypothetical protein [unclassified Mycolicibacterium]|uniref:hypothetical protein n=1 Tax=unclassified Mycolicibacterium TaxID=2636767 RepID=UPI00192E5204|nr:MULTISPECIES: hypothetical protein [unclassified Mycolicibacterium]